MVQLPGSARGGDPKDPAPAFYKRRKRRGHEIGQILLRRGVTPQQLREALRIQEEQGGHLGAILVRMGACSRRVVARALIEQVQHARQAGNPRNLALRARANPSIIGLQVRCLPHFTIGLVIVTDALVLAGCVLSAWLIAGDHNLTRLHGFGITLVVLLNIAAFAAAHLYGFTPPSPPEELRRSTLSTSLVFFGMVASTWLGHRKLFGGVDETAWLVAWGLSAVLVPMLRSGVRNRFAKRAWWGTPVVVLGAGRIGRSVVRTLQSRPQLGLKPVVVLDDNPARHGTLRATWGTDDIDVKSVRSLDLDLRTPASTGPISSGPPSSGEDLDSPSTREALAHFSEVEGVPIVGGLDLAPVLSQRLRIQTAVVAMPDMDTRAVLAAIEHHGGSFTSVLMIPDLLNLTYFGAPTRDLGGVLGIEVRRQLLLAGPRFAKRLLDLTIGSLAAVMILPIVLVLSVLIKLEGGPVFYRQRRLGQDGVRFEALKFRTMYDDGEQRLQELLAKDEQLRLEYQVFHKLTKDPRVTRVGRVLRKYSLDELPQLWNVLVGDMSLVGPRPYLAREIPDMQQQEAIILRVKPGMTGIWQVTDRNATGFDQRVRMDVEYVRNWSPWLDIYILSRTIPVVLGGTGS